MSLRYKLWGSLKTYDDFVEEARSRFEDEVAISVKRRGNNKDILLDTRSLHYRYDSIPLTLHFPNQPYFTALHVGKRLEGDGFSITLYGKNSVGEVEEAIRKQLERYVY